MSRPPPNNETFDDDYYHDNDGDHHESCSPSHDCEDASSTPTNPNAAPSAEIFDDDVRSHCSAYTSLTRGDWSVVPDANLATAEGERNACAESERLARASESQRTLRTVSTGGTTASTINLSQSSRFGSLTQLMLAATQGTYACVVPEVDEATEEVTDREDVVVDENEILRIIDDMEGDDDDDDDDNDGSTVAFQRVLRKYATATSSEIYDPTEDCSVAPTVIPTLRRRWIFFRVVLPFGGGIMLIASVVLAVMVISPAVKQSLLPDWWASSSPGQPEVETDAHLDGAGNGSEASGSPTTTVSNGRYGDASGGDFQRVMDLLGEVTPHSTLTRPGDSTSPDYSPQRKAMEWLMREDDAFLAAYLLVGGTEFKREVLERYALATLFYSTGGLPLVPTSSFDPTRRKTNSTLSTAAAAAAVAPAGGWRNSTHWLSERHVCDWHGVTCSDGEGGGDAEEHASKERTGGIRGDGDGGGDGVTGRRLIKQIKLPYNNLRGSMTDEIGVLANVETLDLANNQISGTIPDGLALATSLSVLHLRNNTISGNLNVSTFGFSDGLEVLSLDYNSLDGLIPSDIGRLRSLYILRLAGNDLTGAIPNEIADLENMYELDISNNDLNGSLPEAIGRQLTELQELRCSGNSLRGTIPDSFGELRELRVLEVAGNALGGDPLWVIGNLTSLQVLRLERNMFEGTFDQSLDYADATSLQELSMEDNDIEGVVPQSLCDRSLRLFTADCAGDAPELNCSCCTQCHPLSADDVNRSYGQQRSGRDHGHHHGPGLLGSSFSSPGEVDSSEVSVMALVSHLSPEGAFLDPESPQSRALEWLKADAVLSDLDIGRTELIDGSPLKHEFLERYAMATLYYTTGGSAMHMTDSEAAGWTNSAEWLSSSHVCDWYGIACDDEPNDRSVTALNLAENNLVGSLPSELQALKKIEKIDLSRNKISGTLSLERLESLSYAGLSHNLISGELNQDVFALEKLEVLLLQGNMMGGPISIPSSLNDSSLLILDLSDNVFNGTISDHIGNLDRLDSLDLSKNSLEGRIPATLGQSPQLRRLSLDENKLHGGIPDTIKNLQELERLSLTNNTITGTLPVWIEQLVSLKKLFLNGNMFSSSISKPIRWSLTKLETLAVEGNSLEGVVPDELCNLRTLRVFSADCGGQEPRIQCHCCTHCFGSDYPR